VYPLNFVCNCRVALARAVRVASRRKIRGEKISAQRERAQLLESGEEVPMKRGFLAISRDAMRARSRAAREALARAFAAAKPPTRADSPR
jgi:hypothetical protein